MSFNNDEGLAYGWMMLCLYFGAGIVIWMCWSFAINIILDASVNPMIASGMVSTQTANATGFQVNMLRFAPPVMMLFGFVWGVNRAIYKRTEGG